MVSKNFKNKFLSKKSKPYFIAEIGINHNGKLSIAKRMIKMSKNAGADAVKFQKRDSVDLLNYDLKTKKPIGYLSKNEKDIPKKKIKFGGWVYPDTRLEFNEKQYLEIKKFCKKIKIDLIITPWDEKSVDLVVKLKVKAMKIASIDANNYLFCKYVAKKKYPTIISSGMCTYKELIKTNKIFNDLNCPHMFMHCTSAYPSKDEDKNLNCIPFLKKKLNTDIGFSGHGTSFIGSIGSIPLGTTVIEKHVTLNKNMAGPDHAASLDFNEFKELVDNCNRVYLAMGSSEKKFLKSERMLHSILQRKIVLRKSIQKGQILNEKNLKTALTYKKSGILPKDLDKVLNKKVKKYLNRGHILNPRDIFNPR